MNRYARTSALPAIAAALALSSTPVVAQEVPPVPADPAPTTQSTPATDAPVTTDTSPTTQADSPAVTDTASRAATPAPKRTVRTAAVRPAPAATRTATKTAVTTRSVASTPVAVAGRATPATAPAPLSHRPTPLVDLNSKPTAAATPAVAPKPHKKDATLPIAGGALAFLAIGGAAVAMTRRREDHEERWTTEEAIAPEDVEPGVGHEPVIHEEQPAILVPTAFAWNDAQPGSAPSEDRRNGQTHVERARRGPTPDNPSLSLKKRLKRAQFFDQREREAAAGEAVPVDLTAGLPRRMLDESEIEHA